MSSSSPNVDLEIDLSREVYPKGINQKSFRYHYFDTVVKESHFNSDQQAIPAKDQCRLCNESIVANQIRKRKRAAQAGDTQVEDSQELPFAKKVELKTLWVHIFRNHRDRLEKDLVTNQIVYGSAVPNDQEFWDMRNKVALLQKQQHFDLTKLLSEEERKKLVQQIHLHKQLVSPEKCDDIVKDVEEERREDWKKISGGKMICGKRYVSRIQDEIAQKRCLGHKEEGFSILNQTAKQIPHGDDQDLEGFEKTTCLISLSQNIQPTTIYLIPSCLWEIFLSLPPWMIEDTLLPFKHELPLLNKGDFLSFPSYFIHHSPSTEVARKMFFYYSFLSAGESPTSETQKNPWSVALDKNQSKTNYNNLSVQQQMSFVSFCLMYQHEGALNSVLGQEGTEGVNLSLGVWYRMNQQIQKLKPDGAEDLSGDLNKLPIEQLKQLCNKLSLPLTNRRAKNQIVKLIQDFLNDSE